MGNISRLLDVYQFPGFRPKATIKGIFGDPKARVIRLERRQKKTVCGCCGTEHRSYYDSKTRRIRDLSCGDVRVYLEVTVRRVSCRRCGKVKRERLDWLANNPLYTKAVCLVGGAALPAMSIRNVAKNVPLAWQTVKGFEKQYMAEQLRPTGIPAPKVIGIDEIALKKGHTYRIVVSDLEQRRPLWVGGQDRAKASLDAFYECVRPKKRAGIRLAVMDMWKAFESATRKNAPQAAILYDKFHVMRHLGTALDQVRKMEYGRLSGKDRSYIKGQKYTLLSNQENLTLDRRKALQKILGANKRLQTASPC
jgi:transposase